MSIESSAFIVRHWDCGQQHLAAGRYVAARRDLQIAEGQAWRRRDAEALARMYLPLLEARRQIRYLAAEGIICITALAPCAVGESAAPQKFLTAPAGTLILIARPENLARAGVLAGRIQAAAVRTGRCIEALVAIEKAGTHRLASFAQPLFAAGLPVVFSDLPGPPLADTTDLAFQIALPPPGVYGGETPGPGERAREVLIAAWEAFALRWQRRHPLKMSRLPAPGSETAWREIAWLRRALWIDPACEPVSMRIIALAESIARL